ncbi:MAG: hypothetical protein LRY69_00350 [Gammaproteobacteria bacterium]|nr:hypothetical protein [Gammaproteobacteria bacterium]
MGGGHRQPFRPVMEGHTDVVCSVAYSPDGHYIASGGWDKTVHQWIAATGQPFGLVMEGHTGKVYSVAYSPNGRYIASGSSDYTVRQWIAATGSPFGPVMQGHFQTVNSVAYSPNGEHLVSGGKDNRIIVWQALTGFLVWCTRSPWMFLCAIDLRLTKYSIGLQPDQYALLEYAGCSEADDVIRVMASSNLNLREKFLYSISNNLHDLYLNICIRHTVLPNREYLQLASDLLFQININVPDEQKNFIMLVTMSSLLTQEEKSAYINQIDGRLLPQNWQEDFLVWENICKTRSVSDLDIHDVHLKAWQLMLIGLDCIEKGDHQLAKNYFERSLEINPSNALTVKNFFYELTDEMSSLYDLQYAKRLMKDFFTKCRDNSVVVFHLKALLAQKVYMREYLETKLLAFKRKIAQLGFDAEDPFFKSEAAKFIHLVKGIDAWYYVNIDPRQQKKIFKGIEER